MSKYLMNKFLYTVDRDPELVERYREDPRGFVARWERERANQILNCHSGEASTWLAFTDDELDAILTDELEPRLRDGDPAGAAIAAVEALGRAADSPAPTEGPIVPGPVVTPVPTPPPGGGSARGGGLGIGTIVGLLLLAGGGFVLFRWWRARQATPAATATANPISMVGA